MEGTKDCKICGETKPVNMFRVYRKTCWDCSRRIEREKYHANKEERTQYIAEYREKNKEKVLAQMKTYRDKNKDLINEQKRQLRAGLRTLTISTRVYKITEQADIDKHRAQIREYIANNLEQQVRFKIGDQLHAKRIKQKSTLEYLGAPMSLVMEWFEFNFRDSMSWDNRGSWHIDHNVPVVQFNLKSEEEVGVCFDWKNLMPLPSLENYRKHDRIIWPLIWLQEFKVRTFCKQKGIVFPKEYFNKYACIASRLRKVTNATSSNCGKPLSALDTTPLGNQKEEHA